MGSWPTDLLATDQSVRDCCLVRESAMHILVKEAAETLQVLRSLWRVLPGPAVPETSADGYWIIQKPADRVQKPLRAVRSAKRRVALHRDVLPGDVSDGRGLKTEDFQTYLRTVADILEIDDEATILSFLRSAPGVYWAGLASSPGSDAQRFPGGSVLMSGHLTAQVLPGIAAAIIPSSRARAYQRLIEDHQETSPFVVIVHYATRAESLKSFLRGRHSAPCQKHAKADWYIGPILTGVEPDVEILLDDEEEEA